MKKIISIGCLLVLLITMSTVTVSASAVPTETAEQKHVRELGLDVDWLAIEGYPSIWVCSKDSDNYYCIGAKADDGSIKFGYLNEKGELAIPPLYDWAENFRYGSACVTLGDRRMIIDKTGKEVLDVSAYDQAWAIADGRVRVTANGGGNSAGIINLQGDVILPCVYSDVGSFKNGLLWANKDYGNGDVTTVLFDGSGTELNEIDCYSLMEGESADDPFIASKGGQWGVVDKTGKVIVPMTNSGESESDRGGILRPLPYSDGLAVVPGNGKLGYIDREGKTAIPFQFDEAYEFSGGLALVKSGGKYGYVDTDGNMAIPFGYDRATTFDNGYAEAVNSMDGRDEYFIIGKSGMPVIGPKDYWIFTMPGLSPMYVGYDLTKDGQIPGGYALLDKEGNRLTEFKYGVFFTYMDGLMVADDGSTWVSTHQVINQFGALIVPPVFDFLDLTDDKTCVVSVQDSLADNNRMGILRLPADAATRKPPAGERPITVYLDGLDLLFDTEPTIMNGRTMVPMRKIFETLGADVSWDGEARKVTAVRDGVTVELAIGKDTALINGEAMKLDAPAMIRDGRSFVPLRFVAEALNCDVSWDAGNRRAMIETAGN